MSSQNRSEDQDLVSNPLFQHKETQTSDSSIKSPTAINGDIAKKIERLIFWIVHILVFVLVFVIGVFYLDECTVQPLIPICLWVRCCAKVVQIIFILRLKARKEEPSKTFIFFITLSDTFVMALFIAGSVLIFSVYPPEYNDKLSPRYCNYGLYSVAFYESLSWITFFIIYFIMRLTGVTI